MKEMFRGRVRRIHFVGIGGAGMCGIAEVLLNLGYDVSGSDLKANDAIARLLARGAKVYIGHEPRNVAGTDVVVRSTAVREDNVEIMEAVRLGIPVIRRAEMLAELMRLKYGIAVAGTHGKTTTASMLSRCLAAAGLDPTVVIGGRFDAIGSNAALGTGPYLVAEADESDGTFMLLAPTLAVVTNIDPEHLDYYGTFERLEETFIAFVNKVPFYGCALLCMDHPVVQRMLPKIRRRYTTFGSTLQAEIRGQEIALEGLTTRFAVWKRDMLLGEIRLGMPGHHNMLNALGAVAASLELDIPFETIAEALRDFTGVQRRFTIRGEVDGRLIVDDYGHHPAEIRETLAAARRGFPERRVVAVFQPHRFSRVRNLHQEFAWSFNQAHVVLVCPIYAAGEQPIEGWDHLRLAELIREHGHRHVQAVPSLDDALQILVEQTRPGDIVITLGAGDVYRICAPLIGALRERH